MTNTGLDLRYHIANFLLLIVGIGMIYVANNVYNSAQLQSIGFWVILVSVIAFFVKNTLYLTEGSDPDNMISMKQSNRT